MSKRSRNALLEGITWTIVLSGFLIIFFQGESVLEWGEDRTRIAISAILFAVGFILHFYFLFSNGKELFDERDKEIQYRSTTYTLIFSMMYVFILAITLFTIYEDSNYVPVAWLWFLAYTSLFITFIFGNFIYYIVDRKGIAYEN